MDQFRKKIELEEMMRREVHRLFNKINSDFKATMAIGNPVRASRYESQWLALLDNHYRRVQKTFLGVVEIKQDDDEINDLIIAALLLWRDQTGIEASQVITRTTQRNIDDSVTMARQSFSDEGITDYSNRDLAVLASVLLKRKFRGREETIISLETQRAAESTKLITAYGKTGLNPSAVVTKEPVTTDATKTWNTRGDSLVRLIHKRVNGQTVKIDEPYIVNGQQLMYPGDMSRGASIGNTANCRCQSEFRFP